MPISMIQILKIYVRLNNGVPAVTSEKCVHVLIPGSYKYVTLQQKGTVKIKLG